MTTNAIMIGYYRTEWSRIQSVYRPTVKALVYIRYLAGCCILYNKIGCDLRFEVNLATI